MSSQGASSSKSFVPPSPVDNPKGGPPDELLLGVDRSTAIIKMRRGRNRDDGRCSWEFDDLLNLVRLAMYFTNDVDNIRLFLSELPGWSDIPDMCLHAAYWTCVYEWEKLPEKEHDPYLLVKDEGADHEKVRKVIAMYIDWYKKKNGKEPEKEPFTLTRDS